MTELSFRDFIQRATAPKREDFFSENTLCAVTYLIGILLRSFTVSVASATQRQLSSGDTSPPRGPPAGWLIISSFSAIHKGARSPGAPKGKCP